MPWGVVVLEDHSIGLCAWLNSDGVAVACRAEELVDVVLVALDQARDSALLDVHVLSDFVELPCNLFEVSVHRVDDAPCCLRVKRFEQSQVDLQTSENLVNVVYIPKHVKRQALER